MGGIFSRQRAESVSLAPAPSSPTHSNGQRSNSSGSLSSGSPKSPRSPVTLALPASKSPQKYPGIDADQTALLLPDDLFSLEAGDAKNESEAEAPRLSFCGSVRANVTAQYERFAMSKVGLVTRAFAMSLPQSFAISTAFILAFSGILTPFIEIKESETHQKDYFFYNSLISTLIPIPLIAYDTYKNLYAYFNGTEYTSYGVFRLRSLFMGAALGSSLMREMLYNRLGSTNAWLNFSLTLPATIIPAYLRYLYFKHDLVPTPLNGLDKSSIEISPINQTKGIFNSRAFNSIAAACNSASVGLVSYRAAGAIRNKDSRPFNYIKILSFLIPSIIGGAFSCFKDKIPDSAQNRWKQLEILASEAAIVYLAIGTDFFGLNHTKMPDYWQDGLSYGVVCFSLMCAFVQASRVKKSNKSTFFHSENSQNNSGLLKISDTHNTC